MSPPEHVSGGDTAVLASAAVGSLPSTSLTICAFGAGAPARAFSLTAPRTIGRDADCDLTLDDPALSRRHARLTPEGGIVQVQDLGSRNGTFVDGLRVSQATAGLGSLIRAGNTLLRLVSLGESFEPATATGPLVGGTAVVPLRRMLSLVSATPLPVLLLGETGTGKEVVARLLHSASRRPGPFIPVNCAALPDALVESELFGHVAGAFTGAARARKGLFSLAAGGTLFLDEVGDVPAAAQAKLLRVLDDGMVRAVGAETERKTDVRVLSATNRDLRRAVAGGHFRSDLLARLAAVEVRLPALRERPEDLPALAIYLLERAGSPRTRVSADALEAMALYDWPENVRELDNVLRHAALDSAREIPLERLPERIRDRLARARRAPPLPSVIPRRGQVDDLRQRFEEALRAHGGNVRQASLTVGIARGHAYRLVKRWDVDLAKFRGGTVIA